MIKMGKYCNGLLGGIGDFLFEDEDENEYGGGLNKMGNKQDYDEDDEEEYNGIRLHLKKQDEDGCEANINIDYDEKTWHKILAGMQDKEKLLILDTCVVPKDSIWYITKEKDW
jgi:hypothetical protein